MMVYAKNILFDLDGTLADSEPLKARALSLAIGEVGGHAPPEIYKRVMGQSWKVVTETFFSHAGIQVASEEFSPVFRKFFLELIDTELRDTRGAEPFIKRLRESGASLGLVSSAAPWMVQTILQTLKLQDSFDVVVTGEDVQNHKPNPEAYLLALKRLGVIPAEAIAFEDSESGFMAALAAGIRVFGIRHDYNENHNFSLCSQVFRSFSDCWRESETI